MHEDDDVESRIKAIARHAAALAEAPPLRTVVKSVSATQRPRRPTVAPAKRKARA